MIKLNLKNEEARAVAEGLRSALDFSYDYYMFAHGRDYNEGALKKDQKRQALAIRAIRRIEDALGGLL